MQFVRDKHPTDVLRILNAQRSDASFCDVIIRTPDCSTSSIHAHRCILATSSDYFTGLFRHEVTGVKTVEAVIPGSPLEVIADVIDFMYTGAITINEETVEDTVRLADFLGVPKVLEFCSQYIKQSLSETNCMRFKCLAEFYPLGTLAKSVKDYIKPRMSTLLRTCGMLDMPAEVVRQIISDGELNYVREADLLRLVQDYITSHAELDPADRQKAHDLLECIEFEYLPSSVIDRDVLSSSDTLEWLRSRPQLLERVQGMVADGGNQSPHRRNFVEAIICRGRAARTYDKIELMMYLVSDDEWRVLKQPTDSTGLGLWAGVETMVTHDCCLYSLSSRTEDMNGYMHPQQEAKVFGRLDLRSGEWEQLPSPSAVKGQTILVSLEQSLVAVDRTGKVECYTDKQWTEWCGESFPCSPNGTICFMPFVKGNRLFVLRTFSAGYSFYFSQRSLSLLRLDTATHSWDELSQIELADLFYNGEDANFFGYSTCPGVISFKDELGHTRAEFELETQRWSTKPRSVSRPAFILDIYGSAQCGGRVYFVAKSATYFDHIFAMFDHARCRFKHTQQPPCPVSGLLCHVTIQSSSVELLAQPQVI